MLGRKRLLYAWRRVAARRHIDLPPMAECRPVTGEPPDFAPAVRQKTPGAGRPSGAAGTERGPALSVMHVDALPDYFHDSAAQRNRWLPVGFVKSNFIEVKVFFLAPISPTELSQIDTDPAVQQCRKGR